MIFVLSYSEEKDIQNYLNGGWRGRYREFGREGLQDILLKSFPEDFRNCLLTAKTEITARRVIKILWNHERSKRWLKYTEFVSQWAERILNAAENDIVGSLEDLYADEFPFEKIGVYLTTFPINPYNYEERWFMINRKSSILGIISTAKHELNHFMFYYYFRDNLKKRGISDERIEKLKEALAIYTNPEGNNKPEIKDLESKLKEIKGKPIGDIIKLALKAGWV